MIQTFEQSSELMPAWSPESDFESDTPDSVEDYCESPYDQDYPRVHVIDALDRNSIVPTNRSTHDD